jgi:hypothetical protein
VEENQAARFAILRLIMSVKGKISAFCTVYQTQKSLLSAQSAVQNLRLNSTKEPDERKSHDQNELTSFDTALDLDVVAQILQQLRSVLAQF